MDFDHPHWSPAMYSLKAGRPTITVPPLCKRHYLISFLPLMDKFGTDSGGGSKPSAELCSDFISLDTRVVRSP